MGKSNNQRAVAILRGHGAQQVQVVETFNTFSNRRNDLFGFADLLAVGRFHGLAERTAAIQVTSDSNVSARVTKMLQMKSVRDCLRSGWVVDIWGLRPRPDRLGSTVKGRSFWLREDDTLGVYDFSRILTPGIPTQEVPSSEN